MTASLWYVYWKIRVGDVTIMLSLGSHWRTWSVTIAFTHKIPKPSFLDLTLAGIWRKGNSVTQTKRAVQKSDLVSKDLYANLQKFHCLWDTFIFNYYSKGIIIIIYLMCYIKNPVLSLNTCSPKFLILMMKKWNEWEKQVRRIQIS